MSTLSCENRRLRRSIDQEYDRNHKLRKSLDVQKAITLRLESEKVTLQKKCEQFVQDLKKSDTEIDYFKLKLQELREELVLVDKLAKHNEEILIAEKQALEKEVCNLKDEMEYSDIKNRKEKEGLRHEIKELMLTHRQERVEYEKRIEKEQQQIAFLKQDMGNQEIIASMKEEKLEKRLDQLDREKKSHAAYMEELLDNTKEESKRECSRLRSEKFDVQEKLAKNETELFKTKREKEELKWSLEEVEMNLKDYKGALEQKLNGGNSNFYPSPRSGVISPSSTVVGSASSPRSSTLGSPLRQLV